MAAKLLTPSELDSMSTVDPEIASHFDALQAAFPPPTATDHEGIIEELTKRFEAIPVPPPRSDCEEYTSSYKTRDGTELRLLVYKPKSASQLLPVLVYYHGGGYCIGRPEMNANLYRDTAVTQQCVVVAPQYRLAPKFKFPIGIDDTWDALKHIAAHSAEFGADPSLGFLVGGESAGAGISSLLPMRARDEKLNPPLTGVFLSAGSYFNPDDIPAEYKDVYRSRYDPVCISSPMLSEKTALAFKICHAADFTSPTFRAALDPMKSAEHPKTYLQTCGNDINRDDGIIYTDFLGRRGVETKLDIYPGGPHCFWFAMPTVKQGVKWKEDTQNGFAWLLRK